MSLRKTLIIVESPSKCKKIEQYLGSDYKVIASCGHFTKLDSLDQISFDTFEISYKIDKIKVLKSIREEIKKSKEVILATDDDREGEAIAWALCVFCKLNIETTKKMVFQEITKSALTYALNNLSRININRVKSQQARQILDIYLGYKISPLLWKYVKHKLSAGRCQTPALRLIYENEKEFENLSSNTHYRVKALFTSKNIPFYLNQQVTKENIESFMEEVCVKKDWRINSESKRQTKENPPQILITSSLQQKAHQLFRFSPKATMSYAQELYENGLITYMRTDSSCYSKDFIEKVKTHIMQNYGEEYLHLHLSLLSQNKNKNKSQEAHEGIRVCDLSKEDACRTSPQVNMLYRFIYKHSIQCAMSPCSLMETTYRITINKDYFFQHVDKTPIFKGWKLLNKEKPENSFVSYLHHLYESKSILCLLFAEANEEYIQNKSHYHEASLIQRLETLNIGRPSTYANILQSILDKSYVIKGNIYGEKVEVIQYIYSQEDGLTQKKEDKILHQETNRLRITPLGKQVCEFCVSHFENIFDYGFTNTMEDSLDQIEYGSKRQDKVLNVFIETLDTSIEKTKRMYKNNPETIQKAKDMSLHCGTYKNEALYIKHGKYGYYVCIGKKTKISLKDFKGFSVLDKINEGQINEEERKGLIQFVENRDNIQQENMCVEISQCCSIRKSKYGYYVYYKTSKMKKPKFFKYNDEKDENKKVREQWIHDKNKTEIMNYITKKYNIDI